MKITIINFSGRNKAGNCEKISKYIENKLKKSHIIDTIKFSDLAIYPCSKCEYSCLNPNIGVCDNFDETNIVYQQIGISDLAFYLIPIYSDYPCSNFFAFKERSQAAVGKDMGNYNQIKKCFIFIANTGQHNILNVVKDEPGVENECLILSTYEFKTKGFNADLTDKIECLLKIDNYIERCVQNNRELRNDHGV